MAHAAPLATPVDNFSPESNPTLLFIFSSSVTRLTDAPSGRIYVGCAPYAHGSKLTSLSPRLCVGTSRPCMHASCLPLPCTHIDMDRTNLMVEKKPFFSPISPPGWFGQPIRLQSSDGSGAFHYFGPLGNFEAQPVDFFFFFFGSSFSPLL
ncbi:hypothetical protein P170DRAFT_232509 [Aspergillus steynii IBT 23096]|uniref:Uncharacterized protein n=1 Tax=Aspergillus steynii IBT 23096 TaxID=1392250 RepID=A0A2I2G2D8_9EURO|nr:uncharacterized protein P170DRAFT_232509 [Aspergillus steynii IBT 23096]PLB47039.1 hypothetical protein P170DRAFT_232509 [Aspergillus steynii IBT 23096]